MKALYFKVVLKSLSFSLREIGENYFKIETRVVMLLICSYNCNSDVANCIHTIKLEHFFEAKCWHLALALYLRQRCRHHELINFFEAKCWHLALSLYPRQR
jgi:hypothetical protein